MKKIHQSLISTERRLITLFVWWAFLFLILFEGFFIVSRALLENQFWKERFESEIGRIERWRGEKMMGKKGKPPMLSGVNSIIVENDGTIVEWKLPSTLPADEVREILDQEFLRNLPTKTIQSQESLLLYKSPLPNSVQFRVFIGRPGYPFEDILRDILRFLIMDILILLPFYFMGRYFVRETLSPIGDNMDAMKHFIHDAGHELKTPIAIISGNLQILRDIKEKDINLINESITTLHGMSDSLDGLLELSSLKLSTEIKRANLNDLIDTEIAKYQSQLQSKKITIEKDIKKWTHIEMDPKHFSLLFSNLFKNAIIYNKDEWKILITYNKNTLTIQDTGIWMDKKNLAKIWERFFRVDRSGKNLWSGIWLSIVDRIIKLYGWKVQVESILWEGSIFRIEITR
jgi:signal transduction histidine kinase